MPSKKKRVMVRLSEEEHARFLILVELVGKEARLPASESNVLRMAIQDMEAKYADRWPPPEAPPAKRKRGDK